MFNAAPNSNLIPSKSEFAMKLLWLRINPYVQILPLKCLTQACVRTSGNTGRGSHPGRVESSLYITLTPSPVSFIPILHILNDVRLPYASWKTQPYNWKANRSLSLILCVQNSWHLMYFIHKIMKNSIKCITMKAYAGN